MAFASKIGSLEFGVWIPKRATNTNDTVYLPIVEHIM